MNVCVELDLAEELWDLLNQVSLSDPRFWTDGKKDGANTLATFEGKELWRAFELYRFMWKVQWVSNTVVDILGEVILPMKNLSPTAFKVAITRIKLWKVFWERQEEWEKMLDTL